MSITEPTNIGVSAMTHTKLKELKEYGHVKEMADAYRLGIGLALAQGVIPPKISGQQNVFGVSTIDPNQIIKNAIQALMGDHLEGQSVYRMAERLADWGIQELYRQSERGELDILKILQQVEERPED